MSDVIIYSDGELELDVSVNNETIWLNRSQISKLLSRDVKTIGKHIGNVFKENELEKYSTVANFATVQKEGGIEVTRDVEYYNLDASLKDLGKKWFAFSRLDIGSLDMLNKLKI
jgi:hypothetical protein